MRELLSIAASSRQSSNGADTAIPLLETKLYNPRLRSGPVSRPRLIESIHEGTQRKLTLVSAPAGFGKTTLLAEWLAGRAADERAAGWVSLDPAENEPAHFWAYFTRALQKVHPAAGMHALALLRRPQPPVMEPVLTALINEVNALDADSVVVLDDYHVIEAATIHCALTFLLDHLLPRMHLVLASRSDPFLPLPRLHARGELTELGAADLRFTRYDLAAEVRAPRWTSGGAITFSPFAGAGVGARSYNYRSLDVDAMHNLAAYGSAGGELGIGRVRLRLEARDYVTGFKRLDGEGAADTRNDVIAIAGLRLTTQ